MEEKTFISVWQKCREQALAAGVRMRPIAPEEAMKTAHRYLSGSRTSDGFAALADLGHLEWSLEALAVDKALHRPVYRRGGQRSPPAADGGKLLPLLMQQ